MDRRNFTNFFIPLIIGMGALLDINDAFSWQPDRAQKHGLPGTATFGSSQSRRRKMVRRMGHKRRKRWLKRHARGEV